ncbi:MAG: EAL domain-containing protein [Eubacteriales bacterium]|nr:EAL domain-containing protein [Eubacteriales bacterium]
MKKWISYSVNLAILAGAGALTVSAPDWLSMIIVGTMTAIILLGDIFGVIPLIQYSTGFDNAIGNIRKARETQASMPWLVVSKMESFFGQKLLDRLFEEYKRKVEQERKNGMIVGGIDEAINEEELSLRCWQGVLLQIPGTLTGLGLLGTFIGLITGISSIQVSSVDAALTSIQTLFGGIQVAFYTSISGVILSIVFNIMYKILWNVMVRDLGMFTTLFQRNVIPSVEEQTRYSQKKEMQQIQERLNRLPQNGNFSLANSDMAFQSNAGSESVLMPQILSGLQKKEFTFHLQPRYDLNTQEIIGAEALVRWNHAKLGMVAPSVFIPVLEKNGYITKLDQYIWNQICAKMREWIDEGIRPVPISVNISKTDILALDISELFSELIQKYRLPPRCIEFDIAQNAYLEARNITSEFEKQVQQKGFRIVVDGFKGDFFALRAGEIHPYADAYKLDLRFCKDSKNIISIAEQARNMRVSMVAEGIENMEQMSILRKNGITEGQGFYLSKSVSIEEFEKMMKWRQES